MLQKLSGETSLYPIIGDPISLVKSPQRLTARFGERGHNGVCVPMQVSEATLNDVVRALHVVPNVGGLLVAAPLEKAMFHYCASLSQTSKLLEVVGVVRRNADRSWHGDMLDGQAFVAALEWAGAKPEGSRILQVGAGPVGSAIAVALLDAGTRELVLHDTNVLWQEELVRLLSGKSPGSVVSGRPDPTGCDIVVNATPMGMCSSDPLPVPKSSLRSSMLVCDVVAGREVTPLIKFAQAAGCKTVDGFQMLEAGMEIMPGFFLPK